MSGNAKRMRQRSIFLTYIFTMYVVQFRKAKNSEFEIVILIDNSEIYNNDISETHFYM